MFKKRFQQTKTLIKDAWAFFKMKYLDKTELNEKVLYVNFENPNLYHRFFYLLLKFYQLSGYTIIYPMSFSKFRNLRNGDQYLAFILKERNFLTLKKLTKKSNFIEITDENFSAEYFKNYFEKGNSKENAFHIPMSFHPLMYHKNLWDAEIEQKKQRINSVFCYGNFDDKAYLEIDRTAFNVINRRKLYDFFAAQKDFYLIKNENDLESKISEKPEKKYIFAEKYVYPLPMEQVRETLSHFRYFLCCPGVVMPLCHNVIEAMSVGTVPIIQREYAEVMYPNLEDGHNAIIYNNFVDLRDILNEKLFNISEQKFIEMSLNCIDYYKNYLSPEGMIFYLNQNLGKNRIYLNAEHRSIKFVI